MGMGLNAYPSDASDERAFVEPCRTLMREDAAQREHPRRDVSNGLRWIIRAGAAYLRETRQLMEGAVADVTADGAIAEWALPGQVTGGERGAARARAAHVLAPFLRRLGRVPAS